MSIDYGALWVCQCCMLDHANGECCAEDTHGGDSIAPWSDVDFARFAVWMGLPRDEHNEGCDPDEECECERITFSRSQCEGCGSFLAGERHAFTLWRERQRFPRHAVPLP